MNDVESEEISINFTFSEIFKLINGISTKLEQFQKNEIKNIMPDISLTKFMILRHLWKEDDSKAPFKVIARECNCPPSTLTGVVDSMESDELVFRERDSKDRRVIILGITEKGKNLQDSEIKFEKSLETCCTGFNDGELQNLGKLLIKLDESLE